MHLFEYKAGTIWGSSHPFLREDIEEMKARGIKVVISLETNYSFPDFTEFGIDHHEIAVSDFGVPSDATIMKFIRILRKALSEGKPVLIHCLAGCGRTGTMLALVEIYLYGERNGDRAIQMVRKARPCAIETLPQEQVIHRHATNPISELFDNDSPKAH
jgi:atypical dual specificity phosphatase